MSKKRKKYRNKRNKKTDWNLWLNIIQAAISAIQTAITIYNTLSVTTILSSFKFIVSRRDVKVKPNFFIAK